VVASENGDEEEVLSGLQLVHRGSIQPSGQRQACRYDSLKEFRNGKAIVEGLPLERFCRARWPHDVVFVPRCWKFSSRADP
jgi:hypothetical protein